ncbi:hypothetical protein GRI89_14090 [Altererythrobacter salegens]|uniref:SnoaL-like domain-containing protein n=1 Tax=Croceibacterium salegens TaxID=1737568 RepID=A0A6I4SXF1_9SPHN|nr:nuclear transport factor 2 family protein [Croceibacterium salegens]MXO60671.1 hypothetical protein [Croceibacterium salegens]
MTTIDDLACKIECSDLLVRLCSALDEGRNQDAAGMFTVDACIHTPGGEVLEGSAAHGFLERRPASIATRHIMSNLLVTPTGVGAATATAYILVYRVPRSEGDTLPRVLPGTPQAAGDWSIDLTKTASGWKISRYAASPVLEPAK